MEIVDLWYKYQNRFINGNELLEYLEEFKNRGYNTDEISANIKKVILEIPNEIDDVIKEEHKNLNKILKNSEKIKNTQMDDNLREKIEKKYQEVLKEKEKIKDGGKRFDSILNILEENNYINNYLLNMTDKEMFDLITHYIKVPKPLEINDKKFVDLVNLGIEEEKKEGLWRLAFNYEDYNFDYGKIEDYFIELRDVFYLTELVCAVKESLDIISLVKKVLSTNDNKFIKNVTNTLYNYNIFNEEELEEFRSIYRSKGVDKLFKKGSD